MKKLLIASYISPPQLNSESLLLIRKMRALDRLGWQMTLLTIDPKATTEPMDDRLSTMMPGSVRVVQAASGRNSLFGVRGVAGAFFRALVYLGLPEKQFPWFIAAFRTGRKLLRSERFDAIHSHACFHTSNVVGLALKCASGLPWVAHFSDPWLNNPYFRPTPLQLKSCSRLEEAVIRKADAVVFTTSQTADVVMSKYPSPWRQKVYVIPHGYDAEIFAKVASKHNSHKRLRFVYTGNFVQGHRTPEGLLQALHRLSQERPLSEELEVEFFGRHVKIYQPLVKKLGLDSLVSCRDVVPFEECLEQLAGADVLLLIDAPSQSVSQFLPSKLVDYLPFKKPILGLTPVVGASADLLRRLECPVVNPDDIPGIMKALSDLLQLWREGQLRPSLQFDRVVPEYDNMNTIRLLDGILNKFMAH
ncbi:MAG: hypothetical protein D4R73_07400 [Deltaproteobacteria bacterium]|nr:MAG: hypothetical protein D4R73_07400 [Deltaproteobacteria bacterium]